MSATKCNCGCKTIKFSLGFKVYFLYKSSGEHCEESTYFTREKSHKEDILNRIKELDPLLFKICDIEISAKPHKKHFYCSENCCSLGVVAV